MWCSRSHAKRGVKEEGVIDPESNVLIDQVTSM